MILQEKWMIFWLKAAQELTRAIRLPILWPSFFHMSHTIERLSDNKVKITVTIPAGAVEEACKEAAAHLGKEITIPGFRPGAAPYDVLKQRLGEMTILEHAAEDLIRSSFVDAMLAEDLSTVGQPYFTMDKLAPGNAFVYSAEIALMPAVTKLADYAKLSVKRNSTEPTTALMTQATEDLLRMRMKEVRAESGRALVKGDKAVVHLNMKKDGVVVEGGEAQNHGVYTNEPHYILGFVDAILGMKEGDEKTFRLKFPEDHYQKHIAGQDVDFTVKLNEIFTTELPTLDDTFAQSFGMKTANELRDKLRDNLRTESAAEEERRLDKAVLDLIADKSSFQEIPDLLVNQEIEKMIRELEHHIETQGMNFQEYLKNAKKSLADLKLDFAAPALQRIKVSIVLKEIQSREDVKVDEAEVDAEVDKIASQFKESDDTRKRVYEPAYREHITQQLVNRKTIELLKKKIVK